MGFVSVSADLDGLLHQNHLYCNRCMNSALFVLYNWNSFIHSLLNGTKYQYLLLGVHTLFTLCCVSTREDISQTHISMNYECYELFDLRLKFNTCLTPTVIHHRRLHLPGSSTSITVLKGPVAKRFHFDIDGLNLKGVKLALRHS